MDAEMLSGEPISIWKATTESRPKPPLDNFEHFDVAIVGAGIAGLATAYMLRQTGRRIAVFEAGRILNDVTANTTAKLTAQHDLIYHQIVDTFGFEKARQYAEANTWAIKWVRETAEAEDIACDFVPDSAYVYTSEQRSFEEFDPELEAYRDLGFGGTIIDNPDLPFETVGALRMDAQARFHPLKFLLGLVPQIEAGGIRIFEQTRVKQIEEDENYCRIETEHGPILADEVVVATHYPIHDSGLFVAKLAPYRSYAIAVDVNGHLPDGMFITAEKEEPLRSMRRQWHEDHEILIVGGENHKVGQHDDMAQCYSELEKWARMHCDVRRVLFRWSTQDNWTPDKLPYIGLSPNRKRIYVATGFNGWGMTNGIVAGKLISDRIMGLKNEWEDVYDPSRMSLKAVGKLVAENLNVGAHLIGDRLKGVEDKELGLLQKGEGAVIQLEKERVAAYRDHDGMLHVCSPVCTHMGCQVHFNSAEASWDCPCHGSRFGIDGEVLHGPAVEPLEKKALDQLTVQEKAVEPLPNAVPKAYPA